MSTSPYLEHTDTINGTELHAIHCLSQQQVQLIRTSVSERRSRLTVLMQEAQLPPATRAAHQAEANSIDHLLLNLSFIR